MSSGIRGCGERNGCSWIGTSVEDNLNRHEGMARSLSPNLPDSEEIPFANQYTDVNVKI
jgi:hypothetical protein